MRILYSLSAVLLLTAAAHAQTGKPNPCSLVTKAELQQAAGMPASEGKLNANNSTVCDYKLADINVVGIMLQNMAPGDSMERTVAELKKRKIEATPVAGIGDKAYASSPGYGMQQLCVYKGSKFVIVTVFIMTGTAEKSKALAEKIARIALPRM